VTNRPIPIETKVNTMRLCKVAPKPARPAQGKRAALSAEVEGRSAHYPHCQGARVSLLHKNASGGFPGTARQGKRAIHRAWIAYFIVTVFAIEVLLGWVLSLLHYLTQITYIVLLLGIVFSAAIWMFKRLYLAFDFQRFIARLKSRLRRPLPLLFLIALLLSLAGGLIYLPNNYDALSYRIPRLLDWLMNHGWYWIPTANQRMNFSGTVQEWLFFPFIITVQSDRLLPLVNVACFSFLPSLVFSIFTRLGIQPRVAWWWMWLLPLGMGIVLQAGGVGNDLLSVFFFMVAIDTALRYRESQALELLIFSVFSIALCSGVKLSNVPLVFPWLALLAPFGRKILHMGWRLAIVSLLVLSISILPTLILNWTYTSSFTGDPENKYQVNLGNPLAAVTGNLVMIAENNIAPPVLPFASGVEASLNNLAVFRSDSWLKRNYPHFVFSLNELPQEEASGLGLFSMILFIWALAQATWSRKYESKSNIEYLPRRQAIYFFGAACLAILAFMAKMGSESAARLFLPYYFLIIGFGLWLRDSSRLVRKMSWRVVSVTCAVMTILIVILSPSRPLFPFRLVLQTVSGIAPKSMVERASTVYETYAHRTDIFSEVRLNLSSSDQVLGFVSTGDDLETSLWRPFGYRRIFHVLPGMSINQLKNIGIEKVLASVSVLRQIPDVSTTFPWTSCGKTIQNFAIRQYASIPAQQFVLIDIAACR